MKTLRRLSSCLSNYGILLLMLTGTGFAELPKEVYLISNFHPACCGWLADWSTERNYCAKIGRASCRERV